MLAETAETALDSASEAMSLRDNVAMSVSRLNDFRSERLSSINTASGTRRRIQKPGDSSQFARRSSGFRSCTGPGPQLQNCRKARFFFPRFSSEVILSLLASSISICFLIEAPLHVLNVLKSSAAIA